MAVFEVIPESDKHKIYNPYSALIGVDGVEFDQGQIRIEPPFQVSNEALKVLATEANVEIEHLYTDNNATLLAFFVDKKFQNFSGLGDETRIRRTVNNLLNDLGMLSSGAAFRAEWESH